LKRLETEISGKRLNPFFGNAAADYTRAIWPETGNEIIDYEMFSKLNKDGLLGFVTTKTLTAETRKGNELPRFYIDNSLRNGIQSMGLPNVGIYNYPFEKCDAPTIVSYAGKDREETKAMTQYIGEKAKSNQNIFAVEYNLACPNVPGCPSCYKEDSLEHLKAVRENTKLPIFAKIGYFVEDCKLIDFAKRSEDLGVNGFSAINSPPGMGIDVYSGRSVVKKYGGVFGEGLKPLAVRTVNILHENTDSDIIGIGGIYKYSDSIEFLLAGANAVQISSKFISEILKNKGAFTEIWDVKKDSCWEDFLSEFKTKTEHYMRKKDIWSLEEIIGKVE